jgi:hypothetical protein
MSSHLVVQAILHGIPVTTETDVNKLPKVGDYIEQTNTNTSSFDTHAFFAGFHAGRRYKENEGYVVITSIATVQGSTADNTPMALFAKGFAIAYLMRAGLSVCLGEYRHYFQNGPGHSGIVPSAPVGSSFSDLSPERVKREYYTSRKLNREGIYRRYAQYTKQWDTLKRWNDMISILTRVEHDFRVLPWSSSFGGEKWATCTKHSLGLLLSGLSLFKSYEQYTKAPFPACRYESNLETIMQQALQHAHNLIWASHNNGKCLTKLISGETLQAISNGNAGLYVGAFGYHLLLEWDNYVQSKNVS